MKRLVKTSGILVLVLAGSSVVAGTTDERRPDQRALLPGVGMLQQIRIPGATIEPLAFFNELVARYRSLVSYEDSTLIVQTTERDGEEPQRTETQVSCIIEDNELRVETPGSQIRDGLGLDLPVELSPAMKTLQLKYNLWIAPHMALRFTEDPLKDFRTGVEEGFTPTEAKPVTIDDKPMVHLELKSGDGLSEDSEATFDLFVDVESGLIERIEGAQRMPDGASYQTTLEITPVHAEEGEPSAGGDDSSDVEPGATPFEGMPVGIMLPIDGLEGSLQATCGSSASTADGRLNALDRAAQPPR